MEKQIRTTLILRNDTSTNWAASSLVLKKARSVLILICTFSKLAMEQRLGKKLRPRL